MNWIERLKTRSWATPLCIGSFVIVGFSGILMFLEINLGLLKVAHEWLGVILVLAVIAHVLINLKMFLRYFTKPAGIAIIAVIIIAGSVMGFMGNNENRRPPFKTIMEQMQTSSLSVVAPVVKDTPEFLLIKLQAQGLTVKDVNQTIQQIAQSNRKSPMDVMSLIFNDDQGQNNKTNSETD